MTDDNPVSEELEEANIPRHMQELVFIKMNDTVGMVFLGTLGIILLVALINSERRYRELLQEVR